ncbi:hypothetical protein AMJ85_07015 [candidate division BRC1 bacterium SM23_51]|nr:MAG: hypothetical protein AMJ85_07015 [candidate division BRC1 bacterium SM23_51]
MNAKQNGTQRFLGLDLGRARIGVAVSDPLGWTAQPVGVIHARSPKKAVARIRETVRRYEVGTIVLGLPYKMDGTEGAQASWVRQFGERLTREIKGVDVAYWDERLTTAASESLLVESGLRSKERKQHRDKIAAALILQSYLEHRRSRSHD